MDLAVSPRAAAFGAVPGAVVRVRAGMAAHERWLTAVALGGRGHYAAAATELGRLLADPRVPAAVAAHAAVTRAAHRRQLGGHAAARRDDALGLRLATTATAAAPTPPAGIAPPDVDGTGLWAARVDALVGLAADALGLGVQSTSPDLFDVAGRLLDAADRAGRGHPSWRLPVRAGWVRAELALVQGRAAAAVQPASQALERAGQGGSLRHVLKSRLVLAVARSAAGASAGRDAVAELDAVAQECARLGLLPLQWPCALAAADLVDRLPPAPRDRPRNERERTPGVLQANEETSRTAQRSANEPPSGSTRRRHAAIATLSVLVHHCDPIGKRLMGESAWLPRTPAVT